jgi:hypothetical protein
MRPLYRTSDSGRISRTTPAPERTSAAPTRPPIPPAPRTACRTPKPFHASKQRRVAAGVSDASGTCRGIGSSCGGCWSPSWCRRAAATGRPRVVPSPRVVVIPALAYGSRSTAARARPPQPRPYTTSGDATRCPTGPNALRPWGAHCSGTGEPRRESRNAGLRLRGGTTPASRREVADAGLLPRGGTTPARLESSSRRAKPALRRTTAVGTPALMAGALRARLGRGRRVAEQGDIAAEA